MALDFTSFLMNQKPKGDMFSPIPVGGAPTPTFGKFAQEKMGTMTPLPITRPPAPEYAMNSAVRPEVGTPMPVRPMAPAPAPAQAPAVGVNRTPGSVSASFLEFARQRQAARDAAGSPASGSPLPPKTGTPTSGPLAGVPLTMDRPQASTPQALAALPPTLPPVTSDAMTENARRRLQGTLR